MLLEEVGLLLFLSDPVTDRRETRQVPGKRARVAGVCGRRLPRMSG